MIENVFSVQLLCSLCLCGEKRENHRDSEGEGRLEITKDAANPIFQRFTPRNWQILKELVDVAKKLNRPASQVALNWTTTQPGITSTIIGASKLSQLEDNLRYAESLKSRRICVSDSMK
ncbi:MAG TPA: aldo/keto reductase [Pyrinomonadaceae bacterium]|nr:aldo/keto reductase [Pyrinomonadaceae bacterium]